MLLSCTLLYAFSSQPSNMRLWKNQYFCYLYLLVSRTTIRNLSTPCTSTYLIRVMSIFFESMNVPYKTYFLSHIKAIITPRFQILVHQLINGLPIFQFIIFSCFSLIPPYVQPILILQFPLHTCFALRAIYDSSLASQASTFPQPGKNNSNIYKILHTEV